LTENDYLKSCFNEIAQIWVRSQSVEIARLTSLAKRVFGLLEHGGTLAFAGNGGSASEANHLAAEFVGRCVLEHQALKSISLSANNSVLTSIMNDYGAEKIFSRQVEGLLDSSSLLIGLSTSGKSANVLQGLKKAKEKGIYTVLWTGASQSASLDYVDEIWRVSSFSTPRIQEVHLVWGHLLAELVERRLQE